MLIDTYNRGTWSKVEGPDSISIDPPDLEDYYDTPSVELGAFGCTLKAYECKGNADNTAYPFLVILDMTCTGAIVLVADEISLWMLVREFAPTIQLEMASIQHELIIEEHKWLAGKNHAQCDHGLLYSSAKVGMRDRVSHTSI